MQIPASAGMLANGVLPVTPTQGALLSQVGENAGSTSFAPIEAVTSTSLSREVPEQKAQPNFAPENAGQAVLEPNTNQGRNAQSAEASSTEPQAADAEEARAADDQNTQAKQQTDNRERESEQVQRQQERQEQQDLEVIRQLSQRDAEVRAHEQAHSSVGGQYAGSAQYTYQRGPDGVNYAVGGEVPIDVGAINGDPRATLEKMQIVQRAALAPADPSSQDRRVAALASQLANQARAEIVSESRESRVAEGEPAEARRLQAEASKERKEAESEEDKQSFQAFNDRIAKINEILLAINQNDLASATGQLLDDVV
jgi:hypothetical protein